MSKKVLAGISFSLLSLMAWAKEPVIMIVNGEEIPVSEFEYLYHKNNQQQLSPQTIDEYIELFEIYKLKVADAKAAGIDTTESFKKEMAQYKRDLSAPFITDSVFINNLVEIAQKRSAEEVEANHIMFRKTRDAAKDKELRERLDSIRTVIVNGGDFEDLALRFSEDGNVGYNKGYLGYIGSGRFPYDFETAVFTLPEGQISEVIEAPTTLHIVKPGKHRPSRGKVEAAHIMKMIPKGATETTRLKAKNEIDSIYSILKENPDRFGQLAQATSDDKASARQEGKLPWFGSGEMVPEFEAVAFALKDGEISEPVESMFGWHIIKKLASKPSVSPEEIKKETLQRISNPQDSRYRVVRDNDTKNLTKKHKARIIEPSIQQMKAKAREMGIDSLLMSNYTTMPDASLPVLEIDGKNVPASEMMSVFGRIKETNPDNTELLIEEGAKTFMAKKLREVEEDWLYDNVAEYHNLMKEYNDGSLLYEMSVRRVWDKASTDKEGMENYFQKNRSNYTWTEPHVKGFLIQTVNDSISQLVKNRLEGVSSDSIMLVVRKEFPTDVKIERVLVVKGENPMVDNIVFGALPVVPLKSNLTDYFLYDFKVIEQPEEAEDVKGLVASDYQNELEDIWVAELKSKYPVEVNRKVLKKIKER